MFEKEGPGKHHHHSFLRQAKYILIFAVIKHKSLTIVQLACLYYCVTVFTLGDDLPSDNNQRCGGGLLLYYHILRFVALEREVF